MRSIWRRPARITRTALRKDATFTYNATDNYSGVCTWTTGEGTKGEKTHDISHNTSTVVNSSVAYEARKNSQGAQGPITGFNLNGFSGIVTTSGQDAPVVDQPCMGNEGHDGVWSSVTPTGSTGGLFVNWGTSSYPLPNTVITVA